jgi:hypothetical protein
MCSFVTKVRGVRGALRMRLTYGSFLIFHYIGFTCELLFVALFFSILFVYPKYSFVIYL